MAEEEKKQSFWQRLFNSRQSSARNEKVLEYIVHRINEGASLDDVVEEEYVRRNTPKGEIQEILSNPKIVEAARERMNEEFSSGDLDPNRRPE